MTRADVIQAPILRMKGSELKRLREAAKIGTRELAAKMSVWEWNAMTVSRHEDSAWFDLPDAEMRDLCSQLGATVTIL